MLTSPCHRTLDPLWTRCADGNMNVGAYTSLSPEEKARAERRQALIREAADNARLRQQMTRQ